MAPNIKIGIIGGSGLEDPEIMHDAKRIEADTPYGKPSDVLVTGTIDGVQCVMVSRHGRKHEINPSNVNYRANLWALKEQGVNVIIASTACGSLKEEVRPGHLVFPDSVFDRTQHRIQTFFDGKDGHLEGVSHMPAHPAYNDRLRQVLIGCAKELGYEHHEGGFGVCLEGPRYSSRAESLVYKGWGAALVSMTMVPEYILAKELAIPYANVTLVTDYDCWKDDEQVSVDVVMTTFRENASKALNLFRKAVGVIASQDWTDECEKVRVTARSAVMVEPTVNIPFLGSLEK